MTLPKLGARRKAGRQPGARKTLSASTKFAKPQWVIEESPFERKCRAQISSWPNRAILTILGLLTSTGFAQAQTVDFGFPAIHVLGLANSPIVIAAHAAVQKELGTTDEQAGKLQGPSNEFQLESRRLWADPRGAQDSLPIIQERYQAKLLNVLNSSQMDRLDEIVLQAYGSRVYSLPEVAAKLNFSREQRALISSIQQIYSTKLQELSAARSASSLQSDLEYHQTKARELNKEREQDLIAALTAQQQQQLTRMKGKEFDLGPLQPLLSAPVPAAVPASRGGRGGGFGGFGGVLAGEPNLARELRNEAFAAKMKITEEQQNQFNEIAMQRREYFRSVSGAGGFRAAPSEESQAKLKEFDDRSLDVLSVEQKQLWSERKEELKAEAADVERGRGSSTGESANGRPRNFANASPRRSRRLRRRLHRATRRVRPNLTRESFATKPSPPK